ncbi:hypothetical protein JXB12_13600 [candidate division KSB1 bacterium]|nr:hypothetical protein [candidate division KSB1 bacterium]
MSHFLLYSSIVVLLIGKFALILYLFMIFYGKDLKETEEIKRFAKRQVRKIILPKRDKKSIREEIARYVLKLRTLLWSMFIGELIGYIFLALANNAAGFNVLVCNAIILFLSAYLCQLMTLVDAWIKKKSDMLVRLTFQLGLVVLASILLCIAGGKGFFDVKILLTVIILLFFSSAVIALYTMLFEGIFNQEKNPPYDFNNYSRIVILLGVAIGASLTLLIPVIS